MGQGPANDTRIANLSVPIEGLEYVLSGWSGEGRLYEALAAVSDQELKWTADDARRRARRILLVQAAKDIVLWPDTVERWLPYLPISTRGENVATIRPRGRVDWAQTARRYGWPPQEYISRHRKREMADVTVLTLAWTVEQLGKAVDDVRRGGLPLDQELFENRLDAAGQALKYANVPVSVPTPDRLDIESLHTSGQPWTHVAKTARQMVRAQNDPLWLATSVLAPTPEFRWRLFHLASLGFLLDAFRDHGASIIWRAPMGMRGVRGPNFTATMKSGAQYDIWFEASGAHSHYVPGQRTLYSQTVESIPKRKAAVGPDLAVYSVDRQWALLLECKWSPYPSYVARDGFHQAASYALNSHGLAEKVWSYIIGPSEIVPATSQNTSLWNTHHIRLGATSATLLPEVIKDFLHNSDGLTSESLR